MCRWEFQPHNRGSENAQRSALLRFVEIAHPRATILRAMLASSEAASLLWDRPRLHRTRIDAMKLWLSTIRAAPKSAAIPQDATTPPQSRAINSCRKVG